MNILFGYNNIGSMPAITVNALNKIEGIKAKYISTYTDKYVQENAGRISLEFPLSYKKFKENPLALISYNVWYKPYFFLKILKYIIWADVIHISWNNFYQSGLDLKMMKFFRKKRFVEWVGSDMRVPEVTMQESIWYKECFENGTYEYKNIESKEKSYELQEKFASYGFSPVLVPEMHLYLKPNLFKKTYLTQYRIFEPEKFTGTFFPKQGNEKIIIVHSPSAKYAKGSGYITAVIDELKKQYPIEFILLHNVSRTTVLENMQRCDIFIDQIILGSYASAAIEAMSFGKPTVAYIMPSVYKQGTPNDCPVINANPDTLYAKLEELLKNPQLRYEVGIKSRSYVEKMHNADLLAKDLLEIYKN